jgi:flagellar hook-length control protein FliK
VQGSVPATDSTAVAKATAAAGIEARAQAPATSGTDADANAGQGARQETFAEVATSVSNHAQQETNVQQVEQEFSLPESYAADRAEKVAGQIVRSARLMTSRGVSEIRLRLEPPTLGEVSLRIVSQDGNAVKLEIVARYAETRSLLESGLPALQEALQKEGVELVHVTVDTSGGEQLDSWFANERNNTVPSDQDTSAQDLRDDALDVATADLRTRIAHDGHLDLVA